MVNAIQANVELTDTTTAPLPQLQATVHPHAQATPTAQLAPRIRILRLAEHTSIVLHSRLSASTGRGFGLRLDFVQ